MLDIKFVRENKDRVLKAIKDKAVDLDLEKLLSADQKRRELIAQKDEIRKGRNEIAEKMKSAKDNEREDLITRGKAVKEKLAGVEKSLEPVEDEYRDLMLQVPNITSEDSPVGGEEDFKVLDESGDKPKHGFPIKGHIELAKSLDILDLERGVKVSGFRGYFLKNEGALLQQAVLWLAIRKMIAEEFTFMTTPTLVREFALIGSGHFPSGREEIYDVEEFGKENESKEKKFLVGTAEPSLLAYHADEILNEKDLPVKLCGVSPCYRREVGGYGKDTKGLYRVHEFNKVEQIVLCKNSIEESDKWFDHMLSISQDLLKDLELAHRTIFIATADAGAGKYKQYDIETWMPGRDNYGETHSCSAMTDWQTRRLNIKYRGKDNENHFAYALNNTVVALPRLLVAILENYQQADGSVKVPKVLQEFVGKEVIEPKI